MLLEIALWLLLTNVQTLDRLGRSSVPEDVSWVELGGTRFGAAIVRLDDLNGDGVPEIAVGAPAARVDGRERGAVVVLSGATFEPVAYVEGSKGKQFGETMRRVPDLDGDGHDDLSIGSWEFVDRRLTHYVTFASTRTGTTLGSVNGARFVAAARGVGSTCELHLGMDDGSVRRVACTPRDTDVELSRSPGTILPLVDVDGRVTTSLLHAELASDVRFVLRSIDGVELHRTGAFRHVNGGIDLEQAHGLLADLDGDGAAELIVAMPAAEGDVLVFSGRDGSLLRALTERHPRARNDSPHLGWSLAAAPSRRPGRPDRLWIGAPGWMAGRVEAYELGESRACWRDSGAGGDEIGTALVSFIDFDRDGWLDVLVGGGDHGWHGDWYANGSVRVLSGRTGVCLWYVDERDLPRLGTGKPR